MSGAMYRHVKYSEAEIKLAGVARQKAINRDVLYHGTRYAQSILKTGVLFRAGFDGQVLPYTIPGGRGVLGNDGTG